ncbi:MAG: hypothetical protein AAFP19_12185 [Bacteroidota bacterium]
MDLQQAKIILEKINRLYKSMVLDEKHVDVFEQDLMLSYIRQLYSSFSDEDIKKISRANRPQPLTELSPPPPPPATTKPVQRVVREVAPPPPPKPVAPKVEVAPPPPAPVTPPPAPVTPPPAPVASPTPKAPAPKVEEAPVVVAKPAAPPVKKVVERPSTKGVDLSEYADLFEQKEAKELSEKLSEQPIKDLSKAMGLNDKYLTLNELFGGDQKVFDETIKALNGMSNFDEAKAYLAANIAGKYDWSNKNKKKKARHFIKLVRRRYK